jgi:Ca2+-binding RTX toxin-like protein
MPLAQPTPDKDRTYIAPDATGTAHGTAGADDIFATRDGQTLIGGGGDDIFHIGTHTGLAIAESDPGISAVSTYLGSYTLPDTIDNLSGEGDIAHSLTGNAVANMISAAGGSDVIDGAGGDDILAGGAGRDTFIVAPGNGSDTIADFEAGPGPDVVRLVGTGYGDFATVMSHMTQNGSNAVLDLGGSETLTFQNTFERSFAADDFAFANATPSPSPTPTPGETDTLVLRVAEDAWNGNAQFTVAVDGHQVDGTQTATASHGAGEWQDLTLAGDFAEGPHQVSVTFVNDAWGGTQSTDRNLYVDYLTFNGARYEAEAAQNGASNGASDPNDAPLMANGTLTFSGVIGPSPTPTPQHLVGDDGPNTLAGGPGDDTIEGRGGDDTLIGNGGNDTLLGGQGNDWLVGGEGGKGNPFTTNADGHITLDGGAGNDTLLGGPNTAYEIHAGDGSDTILNADGGTVVIDGYAIGDRETLLSHMTFGQDTATIDLGNGETLTFEVGPPIVPGNPAFVSNVDFEFTNVQGPGGGEHAQPTPDVARSYVAPDSSGTAHGTASAEDIFATGNNQTLIGGGGDDIFHIGTHTGLTIEASDPGISAVSTYLTSYTLPGTVDNLAAAGDYAHRLVGNDAANTITGAAGNDRIDGDGGSDDLLGSGGSDTFVFANTSGHDAVLDFSRADGDRIDLDYSLSQIGHIDNFAALQHWVDQGAITASYTPDTVALDFHSLPGGDTLTIHGIGNLQASDWMFSHLA